VALKKKSDIIFIILTQLLRDFEDRQESRSRNAYPKQSDCFGGDAVAQSSDVVILLNRPAAYGIDYYGNVGKGVAITDPNQIFAHIVKSRNSVPDLVLQYLARFEKMKMIEV